MTQQQIKMWLLQIINFIKQNKYFFIFFITSTGIFLVWLYAFYPGTMTPDSLNEWKQTITHDYDNAHPFLYTLFILLLRKIWDSPTCIALFQLLTTSLLISSFLQYLIHRGVKKVFIFIVFCIFILLPSVGIYNITLWKDVIFTQLIFILLFYWVYHASQTRSEILNKPITMGVFALVVVLTALIRHNGIIYIVIIPLLYGAILKIPFKRLVQLGSLIIALYIFIPLGLNYFFNVKNDQYQLFKQVPKVQLVSSIVKQGGTLSIEEEKLLSQVISRENILTYYHCSAVDYIIYSPGFNLAVFKDKTLEQNFNQLFIRLVQRNIFFVVKDRWCLFNHLIGLGEEKRSYLFASAINPNDLGLHERTPGRLHQVLLQYLLWSKTFPERIIFWTPAFYLVIFGVYAVKAVLRKNKTLFGFVVLVMCNVPLLFLIGVARDFRYLYIVQFTVLFLPLVSCLNKNSYLTIDKK
jgi:hypothetical protein